MGQQQFGGGQQGFAPQQGHGPQQGQGFPVQTGERFDGAPGQHAMHPGPVTGGTMQPQQQYPQNNMGNQGQGPGMGSNAATGAGGGLVGGAAAAHGQTGQGGNQGGQSGQGGGQNSQFGPGNPLNVQHVPEGGVAINGNKGLPLGHASGTDRMIGKMEKALGKFAGDDALAQKGQLRESGGKAAAEGRARAPIQ